MRVNCSWKVSRLPVSSPDQNAETKRLAIHSRLLLVSPSLFIARSMLFPHKRSLPSIFFLEFRLSKWAWRNEWTTCFNKCGQCYRCRSHLEKLFIRVCSRSLARSGSGFKRSRTLVTRTCGAYRGIVWIFARAKLLSQIAPYAHGIPLFLK